MIATPEINWFPRKVIEATPWIKANTIDAPIPAIRPSHADPVTEATAADMNAATSILPSSPISNTPERSENSPARQASSKGVPKRTELSRIDRMLDRSITPSVGCICETSTRPGCAQGYPAPR
ncbi:hypothetical protein GALL_479590 [mine drainage metagenome]|uniref:Uncharacterized protein n=1 Tax=mine drainage metagenome TaxID=410659 RepID=A0A1J5Q3I1_9ZZZZ